MATRFIPIPDGFSRDQWADRLFDLDQRCEGDGTTFELEAWRSRLAANGGDVAECRRRLLLDRYDSIDVGPARDLLLRLAIRRNARWLAFLRANGR